MTQMWQGLWQLVARMQRKIEAQSLTHLVPRQAAAMGHAVNCGTWLLELGHTDWRRCGRDAAVVPPLPRIQCSTTAPCGGRDRAIARLLAMAATAWEVAPSTAGGVTVTQLPSC